VSVEESRTLASAGAAAHARQALAPETLCAYAADWAHFCSWCGETGCAPLPAEPAAVAAYGGDLAGLRDRALWLCGRREKQVFEVQSLENSPIRKVTSLLHFWVAETSLRQSCTHKDRALG
jgi:hypothetical protein